MAKLPQHVLTDLKDNKTSLGDHPAYPPEEEQKFIVSAVNKKFSELTENIDTVDIDQIKMELNALVVKCMKIERTCSEALEKLCMSVVKSIFSIPEDVIDIECKLVQKVDVSSQRFIPEETKNFDFEDINDLKGLTDEVYKRRMLDALIAGAAYTYSKDVSMYIQELFKIHPELPSIYDSILKLSTILLFISKNTISKDAAESGKVDVNISSSQSKVTIKSEGIIFPSLLEETIKGILEIAIAHGLPKEIKRAKYVMQKSDFRLAEVWDLRLGAVLWEKINSRIDEDVEPNFLLMELSTLPVDRFNETLQEIFLGTRRGVRALSNIVDTIRRNKEEDEFNDYLQQQNDKFPIEDGYYTPEELLEL